MAAKKVKLDEEEIPTPKPSMEDLLTEAHQIEADEEEKLQKDQEAKDAEKAIPEVEVDLDEERERTKKETIEAVTKDVVEPLKQEIIDLRKTLTPVEKDDYEKFVDDYTEKNGKAPEWKQVAMFLEERAVKRVKEEQVAQETAKKEEETTAAKLQEDQNTENFKVWQGQLQEMEDKGMLPKMAKPEVGDSGFDARVKLYGHMQATWQTPQPSTNLWEVHAKYYTNEPSGSQQPAGHDAPVSLGQGGGNADEGKDYKYSEIRRGAQDLEGFILKELTKAGKVS